MPAAFDPVRDSVQSPTSETTERPPVRRPSRSASIADVLNHEDDARSLSSSSSSQNVGQLRSAYSPTSSTSKLPPATISPHMPNKPTGNGGGPSSFSSSASSSSQISQLPSLRSQRSPSLQHLLNSTPRSPPSNYNSMAGAPGGGPSSPAASVDGYYAAQDAPYRGRDMSLSSNDEYANHSRLRLDSSSSSSSFSNDLPSDHPYHVRASPAYASVQRPQQAGSPSSTSHFAVPEVPIRSPESLQSRRSLHRLSQSPGTGHIPLPPHQHAPSPQMQHHSYAMGPPQSLPLPPPLPSPHSQYPPPLSSPHSLPSPHSVSRSHQQYSGYGHEQMHHAHVGGAPSMPTYAQNHPHVLPPPPSAHQQQHMTSHQPGAPLISPVTMPRTPDGSYQHVSGHSQSGWSGSPSEEGVHTMRRSSAESDSRGISYFSSSGSPMAEGSHASLSNSVNGPEAIHPVSHRGWQPSSHPSVSPPQTTKKARRGSTRGESKGAMEADSLDAEGLRQQQGQEPHRLSGGVEPAISADQPPKRGRGRPPKPKGKDDPGVEMAAALKDRRASAAETTEKVGAHDDRADKVGADVRPSTQVVSSEAKEAESRLQEEEEKVGGDTVMRDIEDGDKDKQEERPSHPVLSDVPYAPKKRVSVPTVTRMPLTRAEVEQLRGSSQNPLRLKWQDENPGLSDGWETVVARFGAEVAIQPATASAKRKRDPTRVNGEEDAASLVAAHYNSRTDVGLSARRESPILPLRQFNNWVKSVLIGQFTQPGARVLDLGGGKGGDLQKWEKARISEYILADIADVSVKQAEQRYMERRMRFQARFYAFDCFSQPLADHIDAELLRRKFTNVSLQFCMHYGWESVSKANLMLENIARYLEPGGFFVGTIPNCDELRTRLRALPDPSSPEDEEANPTKGLKFGNDFYHVTFDPAQRDKKPKKQLFGHRYRFHLIDAVEGVDEYVVDWDEFVSLADQNGLSCVYKKRFGEVWNQEGRTRDFSELARRMKVDVPSNEQQTFPPSMPPNLWEACDLYIAFAFQKKRLP